MRYFGLNGIKNIIAQSLDYGPTGDDYIDARYERQNTDHDQYWAYYRTFWHLAKYLKPALIVELGGWQGTAAAHFASGCSESIVLTIDHHTDPGDESNKILMKDASNHYDNLVYIQGWTNEKLRNREKGTHALGDAQDASTEVVQHIKDNAQLGIDILFIDSWHDYEEAKTDWEVYSKLLSNSALVICDDITPGYGPSISGMLDFWEELPEPKFLEDRIHPGVPMGFIKYAKNSS